MQAMCETREHDEERDDGVGLLQRRDRIRGAHEQDVAPVVGAEEPVDLRLVREEGERRPGRHERERHGLRHGRGLERVAHGAIPPRVGRRVHGRIDGR